MTNFLNDLLFIFQRVNWLSAVDILLVTLIFFILLYTLRDTQALVLLRGVLFLVVLLALLTSLVELPAFSWLIRSTLPALLLAIPVIFAPEIRRGLERLGRAGTILETKWVPYGQIQLGPWALVYRLALWPVLPCRWYIVMTWSQQTYYGNTIDTSAYVFMVTQ